MVKLFGRFRRGRGVAVGVGAALVLAACSGAGAGNPFGSEDGLDLAGCDLEARFLRDGGVGRDGIPALTDPAFVGATPEAGNAYLRDGDRVVGIVLGGEALAIPHNVLWWHEIVNLNRGGAQVAVTYCPLTGSSLVFDRRSVDGAEFGVSGLLWQNNLIMYDRSTGESLWPQMLAQARCGPARGQTLERVPAVETTWAGWRSLHPDTKVVSSESSLGRDWTRYPYGNYESLTNDAFLFRDAMPPPDTRRPAKERVLGVPGPGGGGLAFPFLALEAAGEVVAVHGELEGRRVVVFWDGRLGGATAFRPFAGGRELTFAVSEGTYVDAETGSGWTFEGLATGGPLAGERLEPVAEAHVAFWGAWAAFHPETELWTGS